MLRFSDGWWDGGDGEGEVSSVLLTDEDRIEFEFSFRVLWILAC